MTVFHAIGYTIGYTNGFPKLYDISYFICNACNVNDYANGDVIGFGYNISYAIGYAISYAIGSAIAIPLAMPINLPGIGYTIGSSIDYAIVFSMIFAKSSSWGALLRRASINDYCWFITTLEIAGVQMLRHFNALYVQIVAKCHALAHYHI